MYRCLYEKLINWKNQFNSKPLIVDGAKSVGKTWLIREFGSNEYDKLVYVDLSIESDRSSVICFSFNVPDIISNLEAYLKLKIDPDKTLIVFDNIQCVPDFVSVLSCFHLIAPNYHVVGISSVCFCDLIIDNPFGASELESLTLFPLSFKEFLISLNKQELVNSIFENNLASLTLFKDELIDLLKYYYFVGGMPEAVLSFCSEHDLQKVRLIQNNILDSYKCSFDTDMHDSTYRLKRVWDSIPSQLSKEKKKFLYGLIADGGRAREYESSLLSLKKYGYIHKISRVTTGQYPLHSFEDNKAFKLYLNDIGLLSAMFDLSPDIVKDKNNIFNIFNNALTEQFVVQQLVIEPELSLFYYTNDSGTCEVDFLVDNGYTVIPLEAEAVPNLRSKSMKIYSERFVPDITVRTSLSDYKREQFFVNIPLYCIGNLTKEIKNKSDYFSDWDHCFVF